MHNDIHGDQVYLREMQNFFFEVLGMMPITHYGAVGDGRTDNYANIQVAIDDANRRGLNYIYVPYGRYLYRGELINNTNVTFIGNPKAEIINESTGAKTPIRQFGETVKPMRIIDNKDAKERDRVDVVEVIGLHEIKSFTFADSIETSIAVINGDDDVLEVVSLGKDTITVKGLAKGTSKLEVQNTNRETSEEKFLQVLFVVG